MGVYLLGYLRRLRGKIYKESKEAVEILTSQFISLRADINKAKQELQASKKTKRLTSKEAEIFSQMAGSLDAAESKILKEVLDVEDLAHKD
jgi:predicted phage tail protein